MPNWTTYHELAEDLSTQQLDCLLTRYEKLCGNSTLYTGRSFTSKICDYCKSKHSYSTSQCPNCGAFL